MGVLNIKGLFLFILHLKKFLYINSQSIIASYFKKLSPRLMSSPLKNKCFQQISVLIRKCFMDIFLLFKEVGPCNQLPLLVLRLCYKSDLQITTFNNSQRHIFVFITIFISVSSKGKYWQQTQKLTLSNENNNEHQKI